MSDLETFRQEVTQACEALPGAARAFEAEGEIPSWKVGGKMFACIGHLFESVSVKCHDTETAAMLIEAGVAHKAKYFHRSWVSLRPGIEGSALRHRIGLSYDIIRASLSKKFQASLALREV